MSESVFLIGPHLSHLVVKKNKEIWVWSDSPHVAETLAWKNKQPDLKSWLIKKGFLQKGELKPARPKYRSGFETSTQTLFFNVISTTR